MPLNIFRLIEFLIDFSYLSFLQGDAFSPCPVKWHSEMYVLWAHISSMHRIKENSGRLKLERDIAFQRVDGMSSVAASSVASRASRRASARALALLVLPRDTGDDLLCVSLSRSCPLMYLN